MNEENSTVDTPTLQINDLPLESESTEPIVSNPDYNPKEKEYLAIKLDRLNDKKGRFESHENYLSKCLTNNLVPNGLKVYIEPSIGNRDEAFLNKWYNRLEEFSRILTKDVVEFCEHEITKTKQEIDSTSEQLKHLLNDNEYNKINEAIGTNQSIREKELQQRKNKKFYGLKYKRDPKNRYDNIANNNPPRSHDLYDASRQGRTSDRNQPDMRTNRYNNTVREGTSYANSVRNKPTYEHQTNTSSDIESKQHSRDETQIQRRPSKQHLNRTINGTLNTRDPWNKQELPLHERISLQRKKSQRNIAQEETTTSEVDARDKEIDELRRRIDALQANKQSHEKGKHQEPTIARQDNENQKNVTPAQRTNMGENKELTEMKSFISTVMETLKDFDKRLTIQLNTESTHLERS